MPTIDPDQGASLPSLGDLANNPAAFTNFYANVISRENLRYPDAATRTALHPANTEGEESYLTTPNRKEINSGTAWLSAEAASAFFFFRIANGADQALTVSSTAPQNITGFSAALDIGTYTFTGGIYYDGPAAGDIKFDWTTPATSAFRWSLAGLATTAATNEGDVRISSTTAAATALIAGAIGVGTVVWATYEGLLTTTAAGTMQMRAAQNTADPGVTTLRSVSWTRWARVG